MIKEIYIIFRHNPVDNTTNSYGYYKDITCAKKMMINFAKWKKESPSWCYKDWEFYLVKYRLEKGKSWVVSDINDKDFIEVDYDNRDDTRM